MSSQEEEQNSSKKYSPNRRSFHPWPSHYAELYFRAKRNLEE